MPGKERLVVHAFANYPSWIKELQQIAHDENTSVSKLIRKAIRAFLEGRRKGETKM